MKKNHKQINKMNVDQIISALPGLTSSDLRRVRRTVRIIRHTRRTKRKLLVEQKLEMSLDDIIRELSLNNKLDNRN